MFERILVPLDGSVLAEESLPYAQEVAGRLKSEVTLMYVTESPQDPLQHMHELYLDRMVEATQRGAERYLKNVRQKIKVKPEILAGDPAEKIVEYADERDISLIVMSTHGRSGIKRWALGSVADKVVRATTRPVALIRAGGARTEVRERDILDRALVPLDGSKEGEAALAYVEELAYKLQAEVVLFQVLTTERPVITVEGYGYTVYPEEQRASDKTFAEEYLAKVTARLKRRGVIARSEVRFGNAAEEIIKFAGEVQADFVAMSTRGRSGVARWVFGSVADRVMREGSTPILLVRPG